MEEAIQDIRDWAERYGDDACLDRLLAIMKVQLSEVNVKNLAAEIWEYDH